MTKEQKVIRAKAGLLELARQLGNVSQACKMMGCFAVARHGSERVINLVSRKSEFARRGPRPTAPLGTCADRSARGRRRCDDRKRLA